MMRILSASRTACIALLLGSIFLGGAIVLTGKTARTHLSTGGTLPSDCSLGDVYYNTGTNPGLYVCRSTNTWVGGNTIGTKTVALTDAQIKALPTTAVTIVAAPGAGLRLKLVAGTISFNNGGGAYTNINGSYASMQLRTAGAWLSYAVYKDTTTGAPTLADLTTLLGGTPGRWFVDVLVPYVDAFVGAPVSGYLRYGQGAGSGSVLDSASNENTAIQLEMDNNGSGNLTGGNAANVGRVTVLYAIEALAP